MDKFIKTTDLPQITKPNDTMTLLVNQDGATRLMSIANLKMLLCDTMWSPPKYIIL